MTLRLVAYIKIIRRIKMLSAFPKLLFAGQVYKKGCHIVENRSRIFVHTESLCFNGYHPSVSKRLYLRIEKLKNLRNIIRRETFNVMPPETKYLLYRLILLDNHALLKLCLLVHRKIEFQHLHPRCRIRHLIIFLLSFTKFYFRRTGLLL